MMVASTSVPRLMIRPSASSWQLTSANSSSTGKLVDRLAKAPDRGVIRRLYLQRQAAKAAERQPIAHRLLGGGIRERVPLLQEQDLDHRQRRITRRAGRRAVDRRKQSLERGPVERLLDPVQKASDFPVAAHHRVDEGRLGKITARH